MKIIRFWLLGCSITCLTFFQYFTSLSSLWNRLELAWFWMDAFSIAFIIGIGGVFIMLGGFLLCSIIKDRKNLYRLFLIFLFIFLWPSIEAIPFLKLFHKYHPLWILKLEQLILIVIVMAFGFGILKYPEKLGNGSVQSLLVFSPVILIFLVQFILYPTFKTSVRKSITGQSSSSSNPAIILFLFDEWSYNRTFHEKKVHSDLLTLVKIAEESLVFHRVFSPGPNTNTSIPQLLGKLNTEKEFKIEKSLFEVADQFGWNNFIVGCYLPYAYWFEKWCQWIDQFPNYKKANASLIDHIFSHLALMQLSIIQSWSPQWAITIFNLYGHTTQISRLHHTHQSVKSVLNTLPEKSFSYFHYSIPHPPFINNGSHLSEIDKYGRNIRLVDKHLEEIVEILKKRKLWDPSIIIITSDHAWKEDPIYNTLDEKIAMSLMRHVPLLIKLPYQRERRDINEEMTLIKVRDFLYKLFRTDISNKKLKFQSGQFIIH